MEGGAFLLDEHGDDVHDTEVIDLLLKRGPELFFILSDDMDLSDEERDSVSRAAHGTISVGPRVLQAHQVVAVLNNVLDRSRSE